MHIDFKKIEFRTEGDVETRLIVPFVTSEIYLGVSPHELFSKEYMTPIPIDKGSKAKSGYYPDFSVWMHAFPVLIVEAKAPGASVEQGYREATLYAQQLNMRYISKVNPANFIIATNGLRILCGQWDAVPEFDIKVSELHAGGPLLEEVIAKFGKQALEGHASKCLEQVKMVGAERAFNRAGGQALLNAKIPLNSFAAELSPVLRMYFSSTGSDVREISERAYVSSAEITEYDRVLEVMLQDRVSIRKDTIVESIETTKNRELRVEGAISEFARRRPKDGQLQIIQGAVGAGKSLFIRRFQQFLQSDDLRKRTRWAWIDFNSGPPDLSGAQTWLSETFIESFEQENSEIDMASIEVIKGIFSRQIQRRKPIYEDVAKSNPEAASRIRGDDLVKWQDDATEMMRGIGNYIRGVRKNEVLITVMDNVDRLDLKSQLYAFQLALWFMEQTKAFVILQMRDETYERFKNKPPLDTFRTGIAFHISPPRFIDVVKRRLDLSIEYLTSNAKANHRYDLPSGIHIVLPNSALGKFLGDLYREIFDRRGNIARVLESLAGLDVRKALDMFIGIITSGHLREDQITSRARGAGEIRITERNLIKILMRGEYRFFSDQSGPVCNIFALETSWAKPSNFLLGEILFYLARNRKTVGQLGIEGYFSVDNISQHLQRYGFDRDDILDGCNTLLKNFLVSADHMNNVFVKWENSIKIAASGYIHLRILAEQLEFVFGILPTTRISDDATVDIIVEVVGRESTIGDVSDSAKVFAVRRFAGYLNKQANIFANQAGRTYNPNDASSGTAYMLGQVNNAIEFAEKGREAQARSYMNWLD